MKNTHIAVPAKPLGWQVWGSGVGMSIGIKGTGGVLYEAWYTVIKGRKSKVGAGKTVILLGEGLSEVDV